MVFRDCDLHQSLLLSTHGNMERKSVSRKSRFVRIGGRPADRNRYDLIANTTLSSHASRLVARRVAKVFFVLLSSLCIHCVSCDLPCTSSVPVCLSGFLKQSCLFFKSLETIRPPASIMSSPDEPTKEHDTEDLPQVLALRLQSSILADEEVQGLHIPLQVLYGLEETPPASRTEHDASFVDESGKILQSVSSRAVGDNITGNTNQRWEFIGSSKTNQRLVLQPSTRELKDIGIKARNRLEEEKTKRPEIQILDQMPTSDPEKRVSRKATTAFSAKVASQKPAASTDTSSSRKRKLDTSSRLKSTPPRIAKKGGRNSSQPSSWAPDVSHIELPDKDDRSATVKLHGLPINCTTELVKKFFAGLQLQHISILLPNNTSMAQLDVANPLPSRRSRCEHCRLRVLAQFQSASAAILASERSGETIRMQHHDNADEEEYVVAVTVLPRQLAKALTFVVRGNATPHNILFAFLLSFFTHCLFL